MWGWSTLLPGPRPQLRRLTPRRAPGEGLRTGHELAIRWHPAKLLKDLEGLEPPAGEAGAVVRREQDYFAQNAARMNCREHSLSGQIGSGVVESGSRQHHGRIKRADQF